MDLQEIMADIHAINEDLEAYERKYGVLSETFYESYISGEEPKDDVWVLDWADWAGAYKLLLRRQGTISLYHQNLTEMQQEIETFGICSNF